MGILDVPSYSTLQTKRRELYGRLISNSNGPVDYPAAAATAPTFAVSTTNPITSSVGVLYSSPLFTFNGLGNPTNTGYTYQNNPTGLGTGAVGRIDFWVEFDYYGSDFAFLFSAGTANPSGTPNLNNSTSFWVWVDGVPQTSTAQTPAIATGFADYYYRITFGSVANRRIRIYYHNAYFGSFYIGPKDTISKVAYTKPKIVLYGDSWIAYNNTATPDNKDHFSQRLAYMLNADVYLCGISGTGYSTASNPYTNTTRLSTVATINPDLIYIEGSINDASFTSTTVANFNTVMTYFQTNLPNTPVIMAGVQGKLTSSTNNPINNTNILAAAANYSNIVGTIDTLGEDWITGTGNQGTPTSTGNGNYFLYSDGAHLNATGAAYWAKRTYGKIINIAKAGLN